VFWRKKSSPEAATSPIPAAGPASTESAGRAGYQPLARIQPRSDNAIIERRIAPRVAIARPIVMKVASAAAAVSGQTINISKSGRFIAVEPRPAIGSVIDIELELPDHRLLLHAKGTVVRHSADGETSGVGVHFSDVSYEAQELLDALLARGDA